MCHVVVDGAFNFFVAHVVAHAAQFFDHTRGSQQVEQHVDVSLFGQLVIVGRIVF